MPRQREFRVFVVEGQTAERTVLAQIVRRDAAFIPDGEAATTDDALKMLDAQTAAPDIIVLSWLLDGGEACRWAFVDELRRRCPDARLVMTCPKERPGIVRTAREHGIVVLHATRDSFHSLRRALHHAAQEQAVPLAAPAGGRRQAEALNPRHQEILGYMSEGASRPEIAQSSRHLRGDRPLHSKAIFAKLGVNERAHAVAVGFRLGLIA